MSSFDNINIESIHSCYEIGSGLKTQLYCAPASFFFKTPLPVVDNSFESEIKIDDEIMLLSGKNLCYIDVLIDENELRTTITGSIGRKKSKTTLSVFILGFRASVLGFVERCKNEPMIFFIKDSEGKTWQIGHSINRAFIENAESSSGKKYEDNSGASITVSCNSVAFIYNHSLEHFARPGDFNSDFNSDFFIKHYE